MANITGGEGNDTITGTIGDDVLTLRAGDDLAYGLEGDDVMDAGAGTDTLFGGQGNDTLIAALGGGELLGGEGDDAIFAEDPTLGYGNGEERAVTLFADGGEGNDSIIGKVMQGTFLGGAGDDTIQGWAPTILAGDGNDRVALSTPTIDSTSLIVDGGAGFDILDLTETFMSYTPEFGDYVFFLDTTRLVNFEMWILQSQLPVPWVITDVNIPDSGLLTLYGGDHLHTEVDAGRVTVGNIDYVYNQSTSTGNATFTAGAGDDRFLGGRQDDTFRGNAGDDFFDGGDGRDTAILNGAMADYIVEEVTYNTFRITDTAGTDGIDTIIDVNRLQFADQTIDLVIRGLQIIGDDSDEALSGGDHADHLVGAGGSDTLSGADGNDSVDGGSGDDNLIGDAGNDFLNGDDGGDLIDGGSGDDSISGGEGDDLLYSADGNDTVDGGLGDDLIVGGDGAGDDHYFGGDGIDTLRYTSAAAGIVVDLARGQATGPDLGTDRLAGIENLIGGQSGDVLRGGAGANRLQGHTGNDRLEGRGGNDMLDGGSGDDTMSGGAGNDTYVVDSQRDRVIETSTPGGETDAGGVDTVLGSVSFSLVGHPGARFVERLELQGTADIAATGNALANRLVGNSGHNRLDGGVGADTLLGGDGNDTYIVDHSGDRVIETTADGIGGIDTVRSSVTFSLAATAGVRAVEHLVLTGIADRNGTGNALDNRIGGNAGDNRLAGAGGDDTLTGGAGRDTLLGGAGKDRLTGGADADIFVFRARSETGTTAATRDIITDFLSGTDLIDLRPIDADTTRSGNQAFTFIGSDPFSGLAGQLRFANGLVAGDVDGDGRADFQIALGTATGIAAADFLL